MEGAVSITIFRGAIKLLAEKTGMYLDTFSWAAFQSNEDMQACV